MMMDNSQDYSLFQKFIEKFSPIGFNGINRDDPLMLELELLLEMNNQFFFVGDIIKMKILFTSKRSSQIIGIEPENITPYHFFEATHPDDIQRHSLGRTQLFKMAQDLFIAKKESALVSSNFKILGADEKYKSLLFQSYLFYSENPVKTVYVLQVHTDVEWCKNLNKQFHYYSGTDLSLFKYPNEELMQIGNIYTKREFEIIKLIELGLNSVQIAKKLFVSTNTVNAHRGNILKKSGKTSIYELIHNLMEQGLL
jgi:DNA-binding CsgD family transcriptional regulator